MTHMKQDRTAAEVPCGTPVDRHVRRPAQEWMRDVAPGHMLRIKPLWNNTERGPNCIPVPCKVLAVQLGVHGCQSGALFTVRTKGGNDRTLDAGWFQPPNVGVEPPERSARTTG